MDKEKSIKKKQNKKSKFIPIQMLKQFSRYLKKSAESLDEKIIKYKTKFGEEFSDDASREATVIKDSVYNFTKICTNSCLAMFSFDEGIYLNPKLDKNQNKWKPVCFNQFSKDFFEKKDYADKVIMIKKTTPVTIFGKATAENTLGRRLTQPGTRKNLYNSFKIDIYFERENGDEIEYYKGGWNSEGQMHGFGMLYNIDDLGVMSKVYRGDFYKGKICGSGMKINFLESDKKDNGGERDEGDELIFEVLHGEFDRKEDPLYEIKKKVVYNKGTKEFKNYYGDG